MQESIKAVFIYAILGALAFFFVGIGALLVAESIAILSAMARLHLNQRQEGYGLLTLAFVDIFAMWLWVGFWKGLLLLSVLGWLILFLVALFRYYFKSDVTWIYRSHFGQYIIEHVRFKAKQ